MIYLFTNHLTLFNDMNSSSILSSIKLMMLLIVNFSFSLWVPYTQFFGHIPSYTYPIQINAGNVLRGLLSWTNSQDLDIYLYRSGMDLLSRNTWVDRQYSPNLNPEDLVRTITTPGLYYLRVDLFTTVPTKYKFQIFINGQLKATYFDTLITVTAGRTIQQFEASGPCQIKVYYDGPIHDIYLFSPGTNVMTGAPFSSNTLPVNPKDITVTLSMAGLWNIVIHHGLTSTTVLIPFKIIVYTNRGVNECTNYCSNIPYSAGIVSGYTSTCYCQDNFIWDDVNKVCYIDCPSLNSTGIVGPKVTGTVDQCVCTDPDYSWSLVEMNCMLNCSLFPLTVSQNGLNSCNCVAGFKWDSATRTCIRNCSLISYTVGNDPSNTSECLCQPNLVWDPALLICQVNCTAIQYATTATAGATDRCQCQPGFYWDSTMLRCTIDCSLFGNVSSLPVSVLTVDQCLCDHSSFSWSTTSFQCELNCSLVPNSQTTAVGSPACACETNFEWDPILFTCDINCALFTHATNQTSRDSCNCIEGYEWSSLFLECVVNCSSVLYALPASTMTQNTTEICECQAGFIWILQPPSSYCAINCSEFDDTVSILSGSIDECVCRQKYIWNPNVQECVLNCSTIDYTLWINSTSPTQLLNVNGSCLCEDKFIWNSVAEQCEVDCRVLNNTSANVSSSLSGVMNGTVDECGCDAGFEWNITALECELMDQMPQIMQTQHADWLDGQVCSQTLNIKLKLNFSTSLYHTLDICYYQPNNEVKFIKNSDVFIQMIKNTNQLNQIEITARLLSNLQSSTLCIMLKGASLSSPLLYPVEINSIYAAALYSQQQCRTAEDIDKLIVFLQVAAYLTLGLGLFSFTSKLVGLQLIGVLQLAYFSVVEHYKQINLYIAPLAKLKSSNGLNIQIFEEDEKSRSPIPITLHSQLGLYKYLSNNFNIMLFLFLLYLLVFLLIKVIKKLIEASRKTVESLPSQSMTYTLQDINDVNNAKKQDIEKNSTGQQILCSQATIQTFIKQGITVFIMFNVIPLTFNAVFFYSFIATSISNQHQSALALTHLFIILFLFIAAPFFFFFLITGIKQDYFGQFKDLFKNNCLCRMYVPISILYRITVAAIMAHNIENMYGTLFVLFVSIAFVMFNMINLPFSSPVHNYRAMCIHVTQLVTLVVANYYRSMKANTGLATKSHLHSPALLLIACLCMSTIMSIGVKIYQIVKAVLKCSKRLQTKPTQ